MPTSAQRIAAGEDNYSHGRTYYRELAETLQAEIDELKKQLAAEKRTNEGHSAQVFTPTLHPDDLQRLETYFVNGTLSSNSPSGIDDLALALIREYRTLTSMEGDEK